MSQNAPVLLADPTSGMDDQEAHGLVLEALDLARRINERLHLGEMDGRQPQGRRRQDPSPTDS